jgi:hypothetical protein
MKYMTYAMFKNITTGLLIGDNVLPADAGVLQGLVSYALTTVAMQADSLHLMTLSTTTDILRLAQGDYLIRVPATPVEPTDLMDIDEELVFAVARYLASYISKDKGGIHVNAADRIIKDYNGKTYEIIDQMEKEIVSPEVTAESECYINTEWSL